MAFSGTERPEPRVPEIFSAASLRSDWLLSSQVLNFSTSSLLFARKVRRGRVPRHFAANGSAGYPAAGEPCLVLQRLVLECLIVM